MSEMSDAVSAIESSFSQELTSSIRSSALEAGWPKNVADMLSVTADGGVLYIGYEGARDVVDWEYGTQERAASPVIRRWLATNQDEHETIYWERVSQTLWAWV